MQREKQIEQRLLGTLREKPTRLEIWNSTSNAGTMADLLCGCEPTSIHDNSAWNPYPKFMQDIIGLMTPDIVLQSKGENRIYIEVKDSEQLGHGRYGIEDSQIIRYFLHLLATTTKNGATDMKRAVLLCAPAAWFKQERNAKSWAYFLEHYSGLAKAFDITLGELHADSF